MYKRLCILAAVLLLFAVLTGGCSIGSNTQVKEESVLPVDTSPKAEQKHDLKICFIDCGQGDAILIKSPEGQYMLIDGGGSDEGKNIINFMRSQGVEQLAVVVGTHPHSDHIGGLAEIVNSFPVGKVYLPRVTHNTKSFEALLEAVRGQNLKINTARQGVQIPLEGLKAYFLAPAGDNYDELNNYSAVVRIDYGENSFIFTGDAEEVSEQEMLNSKQNLDADVLKVGHHGSSSSTSPEFLRAVSPQYAVIMCGAGNDYGHPHQETLKSLNNSGAKIYRTDLNGTIIVSSDGQSIGVECIGGKTDNTSPAQADTQGEVRYMGNKNSRIFHRTDCKNLPLEKNRIILKNRDEALKQGYSPCANCQP